MSREINELEITKGRFLTDSYNLYQSSDNLLIEDCRFMKFTELLDDADVFKNPINCRAHGKLKRIPWEILGYSFDSQIIQKEEDDDDVTKLGDQQWSYTIFNGSFNDDLQIVNVTKLEIQKRIKATVNFIENSLNNILLDDVSEVRDLQLELLNIKRNNSLERIDICILTDGVINIDKLDSTIEIPSLGTSCRIYYWDLKKWNDLKRSKAKRLPIDIDFNSDDYSLYNINYVVQKSENMTYFLAIFPADLLADLYDYHSTRLLENNVRVFLSATRKANKAIRQTIKEFPDRFFSFNNGISATASSVKIINNKIVQINDFQIVNGGQTTATIHYAKKKDKAPLANVFVQVKITSLKKDKEYAQIVANIAKAANTQTAIKTSDFYANDPILIDIERYSDKLPVQNKIGKYEYYFFERMAGQYQVTKLSKGTNSKSRNVKAWEASHPKEFNYGKIDIARWSNTMNLKPHVAALSAEKQFTLFMDSNIKDKIDVNEYKDLIGFGLLFKRARMLTGKKNNKLYPPIIGDSSVGMATTIYAMSYLQYISKGLIDYHEIHDGKHRVSLSLKKSKTRVNSDFDSILSEIIKACWDKIAEFGETSAQEQTKFERCWNYVKNSISLDTKILNLIDSFKLTSEDKKARLETTMSNEEYYFNSLEYLLSDNGSKLLAISEISNTMSEFKRGRTLVKNFVKRIREKKSVIVLNKIRDIMSFKKDIIESGIDIATPKGKDIIDIEINNFSLLFNKIFKSKAEFDSKIDDLILNNIDDNLENVNLAEEMKSLVNDYDIYPGLSIDDFD